MKQGFNLLKSPEYNALRSKHSRVGRPRAKYRSHEVPPAVRTEIAALKLQGETSDYEIAKAYGVDRSTVARYTEWVDQIDREHVLRLKRSLPDVLAILATGHALEALSRVHSDPAMSVRSTFGMKLAVESMRNTTSHESEAPGTKILAFIRNLSITPDSIESGDSIAIEQSNSNGT